MVGVLERLPLAFSGEAGRIHAVLDKVRLDGIGTALGEPGIVSIRTRRVRPAADRDGFRRIA